jgi:dGTP triphosphohydrolase
MELEATEWRRAMNAAQVTECDAEQVVTETAPSPRLSRSELLQSQMTGFAEPEHLQELQLLTDMISGMTDTFAMNLCDDLQEYHRS